MPIPGPALPAFSRISALARSSSCRTSVVVSFASCLSRSPIGRSCSSSALDVVMPIAPRVHRQLRPLLRVRLLLVLLLLLELLDAGPVAGLVPAGARGLHEPRRNEPER